MARRTETESQARARLNAEILEAAKDAHAGGVVNDATYDKITMRQLDRTGRASLTGLSGEATSLPVQAAANRAQR